MVAWPPMSDVRRLRFLQDRFNRLDDRLTRSGLAEIVQHHGAGIVLRTRAHRPPDFCDAMS